MTNHTNDERTVRCPVEGCDATPLARGINLHLMRTSGDGHGPQGDVPEHLNLDNLKTVGAREVKMDYPEERDNERYARLCPYCSQTFSGAQGLMTHLGTTAGRKNHPENPRDRHRAEDFPQVEVDVDGNVEQVVETNTDVQTDDFGESIPIRRAFDLIADLIADGEMRTAHRVRRALIESDDAVAPSREAPPHPDLFEALLTQGRADTTSHVVGAALETEGLMINCRGESAFLNAAESRDVAERLKQVAVSEGWYDVEVREFVEFLQYGAGVLDGDKTQRGLHEEFDNWR